jgi:hypothetical protein
MANSGARLDAVWSGLSAQSLSRVSHLGAPWMCLASSAGRTSWPRPASGTRPHAEAFLLMPVEDLPLLELRLTRSEAFVVQGNHHVERQRQIVAQLERDGHDSTGARELLGTLEQSLALHIDDRDRLRKELGQAQRR